MRQPSLHVNGANVKDYPVNLPLLERNKSDLMAQLAMCRHRSTIPYHTMAIPYPQVYQRHDHPKPQRTTSLAKLGLHIRPNPPSPHNHMNPTFASSLAMR